MSNTRRRNVFLVVVVIALACFARVATAGEPTEAAKAAYLKYCSACHGSTGQGDGVVSGFLRPRPTDLTQAAKKAGGEFPTMEMIRAIEGTNTLRVHGDPEMPVWGELLREESKGMMDQEARVRSKLLLITDYLRSIQAK